MIGLGSFFNVFVLLPVWAARMFSNGLFYLGPETIMPLASILATILGFLLIFWRAIIRFIKKRILHIVPEESEETLAQSVEDEQDTEL